jgi:hypothetical protein
MKHVNEWIFVVSMVLCCSIARAQGAYVLTNETTSAEVIFTNSLGTATNEGTMIVFEGQLESNFKVDYARDTNSNYNLASLRLLTQIKLFDELPASNEVGTAQGAVAALRSAPESTTGTLYAWGSTNTATPVMEWVPLLQKEGGNTFSLTDGSTNYITFVFNYTSNRYQVFVGEEPTAQVASAAVSSPAMDGKGGINGVSLLGVGGLSGVASASGDVVPLLSSSVGFSVYATANGILFILDPVNEQGSGWFTVYAKINGEWVEVGKIQSDGSGHYEFLAYPGLLQVGQSYAFRVIDEIGDPHNLDSVAIKTIKMESVVMEPDVMVVTFNTEAGKSYQVISAESLTSSEWTATVIHYPTDGGWGYGSGAFTAAGTTTTVKIPRNTQKAFFKIRKVD